MKNENRIIAYIVSSILMVAIALSWDSDVSSIIDQPLKSINYESFFSNNLDLVKIHKEGESDSNLYGYFFDSENHKFYYKNEEVKKSISPKFIEPESDLILLKSYSRKHTKQVDGDNLYGTVFSEATGRGNVKVLSNVIRGFKTKFTSEMKAGMWIIIGDQLCKVNKIHSDEIIETSGVVKSSLANEKIYLQSFNKSKPNFEIEVLALLKRDFFEFVKDMEDPIYLSYTDRTPASSSDDDDDDDDSDESAEDLKFLRDIANFKE